MEWLKEWAQVLSAGITLLAVFVALGIGVASILHTQSMQKRERKERLLNEIIEWALEVSSCSSISFLTKYSEIKNMWEYNIMAASDLVDKYDNLEKQSEYISRIALKLEDSLGNAVGEVVSNIKERQILLTKSMGVKPTFDVNEMQRVLDILSGKAQTSDGLSEHAKIEIALANNAKALNKSVNNVIEEAVKIKTRDIG